ncbi:hypothetical protein AAFF_G00437480 [Aldrovandia affinis]|uniref:Uncharacterized protein n=1 Tax=Aldrovandia affinis TaxID=143900 RepID=A0AAD7S7L6_9TELE|nr:hypothetical protein AAFF_G00437480 [Aldrovandia affinis]
MRITGSFRFVTSVAFSLGVLSLAQCRNTSHTTPALRHPGAAAIAAGDFVRFDNAPDVVIDGYNLSVRYLCSRPCVVQVEVLVSSGRRNGVPTFRRSWRQQKRLDMPRTRPQVLRFPDAVAYRSDFFVRRTAYAPDVMLRAWLNHLVGRPGEEGSVHGDGSGYHQALARTFRLLETVPPSLRPAKQHTACLSWGAGLMWQLTNQMQVRKCPLESGMVHILKFPLASTGERFGLIHRFNPFINKDLERNRLAAIPDARVTLSVWIYLLSWCASKLCGIIHHIGSDNMYGTPLILQTNTGDILFQVRLSSGQDVAFKTHKALPLRTWLLLDCFIEGSMVELQISTITETRIQLHTFDFQNEVHYNDTAGYFVIGGDKYVPGINGYFGPIRYHRLKDKKVVNPLFPKRTLMQLDETHRTCEETKEAVAAFFRVLKESEEVAHHRTCWSLYMDWKSRFGRPTCRAPPWSQRAKRLYRLLLEVLHSTEPGFLSCLYGSGDRRCTLRFGTRAFEFALHRITHGSAPGFGVGASLIPLLQLSGCLGLHKAYYLLAIMHLAGLGVPTDILQGHVYSLIAAQADERLALMHLGYKHAQGIDGFPRDYGMAYSYYANVGKQTCADRQKVASLKQYTTEKVLLSDNEALRSQSHQTDVYHFLQFQAERGDIESQKMLARILFWGQQGVSKDVGAAAKWFAKSAMETRDAISMYDYSILLFKGQGVKKNRTLALKLMQKAASMGLQEALNGMGWYYSSIMADTETALKYFEKAAKNGSKEAVYNLGVFHLNGNYPGKRKNETAAFQHFLRAGLSGHFEATVLSAWYYASGNLHSVPRDPERAVWMLKRVCEKNGYLGYVVRTGLKAYLRGSRQEALLSYILAAEAGLGVAQNNAAHLCEEMGPKYSFRCEWRYHNYSTFNDLPHYTGFLKMGDYYYHGLRDEQPDVSMAMFMYSRAGLAGSAEGIFNLAILIEEGHRVSEKILEQLNISIGNRPDIGVVLEKLYQRCRAYEGHLDLSPCSLALFRIQLGRAWRAFINHPAQCLLVYVIGTALIAALLSSVIQGISNRAPTVQFQAGSLRSHNMGQGAEPSPANQDEVMRNGWLGRVTKLLMLAGALE